MKVYRVVRSSSWHWRWSPGRCCPSATRSSPSSSSRSRTDRRQRDAGRTVRRPARTVRVPAPLIGVAVCREFSAIIAGGIAPSSVRCCWAGSTTRGSARDLRDRPDLITLSTTFHTPETAARDLTLLADAVNDTEADVAARPAPLAASYRTSDVTRRSRLIHRPPKKALPHKHRRQRLPGRAASRRPPHRPMVGDRRPVQRRAAAHRERVSGRHGPVVEPVKSLVVLGMAHDRGR